MAMYDITKSTGDDDDLNAELNQLTAQVDELTTVLEKSMEKARSRQPDPLAEDWRNDTLDFATINKGNGSDFEAMCNIEIAKGCPPSVAAQRVLNKYGSDIPYSRIAKAEASTLDFMEMVEGVMLEKRCSRSEAMKVTRLRHPNLYQRFQEV
jgi:hypothetical protein